MKQIIFAAILVFGFGFSVFAQNEFSSCPKIEVTGGGVVRTGEPVSFTASVSGGARLGKIDYEWKASAGTISGGQGTPSMTIDTTGLEGENITAEVKIKGLSANCSNTASEVGAVMGKIICLRPFDEFGKIPGNEIKARIQNLYVELENNPTGQGYIIIYGTDEEIASREKQIRKALDFLKLDANRVTAVRGGANPTGEGVWTIIRILPPGAPFPEP
jgi:hypothetical protein